MRKLLFVLSLIGGLLSVPTNLMADEGQKKSIRLFLNTGELLDFDAAVIDSITFASDAQTIWYEDTCRTVAIEAIDSIWYMTPALKLTTQSLDFGKVAVGNTKTMYTTMTNTGDFAETYMLLAGGVFDVKAAVRDITILPGQSINVEITFTPTDSISYSGQLDIASRSVAGGFLTMALNGSGVAMASQEENSNASPVEQTFDLEIPGDDSIEGFDGFKIVNFNGEYALDVPTMARSMRRTSRAGVAYNMCSTSAAVSPIGLQCHALTDPLGNPYMFTVSVPFEKPEFSFTNTAITLLMSTPYLAVTDEADYKNTVALLKQLKSFDAFVDKVRQEYKDAKKNNRLPDFASLNASSVFNELYKMTQDNRTLTLSGVSLKNLTVTPKSAVFKLHNRFKRTVLAYASRVKMNEGNLVVTDREEITMTFGQVLDKIIDAAINQTLKDIDKEAFKFMDALNEDDIAQLIAVRAMLKEVEDFDLSSNPDLQQPIPIWVPFVMESGKSSYYDIVWEGLCSAWDVGWDIFSLEGLKEYANSNETSIFEKETEEMEIPFKGYDKIQIDLYGLGRLGDKSWDSFTKAEQFRILFMLIYGGYNDIAKPIVEFATGCKKIVDAHDASYNFDLRYGAKHWPEVALLAKLYYEFKKDKSNWENFMKEVKKGSIGGMSKVVATFIGKEMTRLPSEAQMPYSEENRVTYVNLIYNIYKKYITNATSAAFKEKFKSNANSILSKINFALRTIDACEALMDITGGVVSAAESEVKQTFTINKYDQPFINVTEPTMTYLTSDVDVHFAWDLNLGNHYGNTYNYALEFVTETLSEVIPTVVETNIKETSFDFKLSKLPNAKSARKIIFRVIAHWPDHPEKIFVMTDFIPLVENISVDLVETPEVVDLGLPSGTKWAVCNFGAKSAKDPGNYYAWGEVYSKATFSWKNYKYSGNTSNSLTKYCTKSSYGKVDNKTSLEADDDRVKTEYGYYWSIPTKDDWQELMDKCTWSRFGDDFMVRGPNGSIILLPAAGYQDGLNTYDVGKEGYYWATSIDEGSPDDAWYMHVKNAKPELYSYYRYQGRCIRPVQHKANYAAPNMAQ